jgi:hypothetical protein
MALPAVAGGTVGALLLLVTSSAVFAWIVPFLIALASVLLLAQPTVSRWRDARDPAGRPVLVYAGLFAISVYGGYFGAGGGVMTLALLLLLVDQNVVRANAFKNYVLMLADAVTAVVFVVAGPVLWSAVLPLAVGALAGGALGPSVARRLPAGLLRIAVAILGFGLAGWLLVVVVAR